MNKYQIIALVVGAMALLLVFFTIPKDPSSYFFVSHPDSLVFHEHVTFRGGALMGLGIIAATLFIAHVLKDKEDE